VNAEVLCLCISAVFVFFTLLASIFLMYKHLSNYTMPRHQRCIVRIIAMVPLYAVYSLLSLIFWKYQIYFAVLRDAYEAYALYNFFILCTEYMGGKSETEKAFLQHDPLRLLCPFCCCNVNPGKVLFLLTRQGILQYVLVRPVVAVASAVLLIIGKYGEGVWSPNKGYLWITIINNLGVTVAIYFLVLFYQIVKEDLRPWKPVLKFGVVKMIVFFCYWQEIVIMILVQFHKLPHLPWDTKDDQDRWIRTPSALQNMAICVEMFVFSLLFIYAFPYGIYKIGAQSQAPLVHEIELNRGVKGAVANTFNQMDLAKDTFDSFVPRISLKKKKTRVVSDEEQEPIEDDNTVELDDVLVGDAKGLKNVGRR